LRNRWFFLALMLLGWPVVAAAAGARPVLNLNQIDISKPPAVRVYLTDLDSSQNPITDRKGQHYRLLVDGVPQTGALRLQRLHALGEPVTMVLVMQVSPAMKEVLTDAVEAAKRLIDSLPRGSRIGLIAYADVVDPNIKPTTPQSAREAVDGLRIREGVEVQLPDAIKDALEGMASQSLPKQRFLVILSDGLTLNLDLGAFSTLGRRAQDNGVVVHAVGYATLEPQRLRSLQELCKRGGGTLREASEPSAVTKAFAALQEEIRSQAVVTYQIPTFFDGRLHDFQVETPGGQASSIVSMELPKVAPVSEGKSVFSSTWFLVVMLVLGQVGLVVIIVLALRWRRRPAPRQRAREDEEEEEGEDDEEDREPEDGDEPEDDEPEDQATDRQGEDDPKGANRVPRARERPSARERRSAGEPRQPSAEARAVRGRRPPVDRLGIELGEDDESTSIADGSQSPRAQLLDPSPLLFDTAPAHAEIPDDATMEKSLEARAVPKADVQLASRGPRATDGHGDGIPSLLPDPQEFLDAARAELGAPRGAEAPSGSVRRGGAAASAKEADGLALPAPDDFMRQVRGQPAGRALADRSEGRSRPASSGHERLGPTSPAVAGSGIPLRLPEIVPASLPPEAGAEPGRFIDRKTKVIAVEELSTADYVAWVVQLAPPYPAVVVSDGFTIGGGGDSQLQLDGAEVSPGVHTVLRLDSRGFRAETVGSRGETLAQPLSDNDHFFVGSHELVFKVASRTAADPLAAARLEVLDGIDMGRKIALPEGEVVSIGAHSSCQLVVRGHGVEKVHAIAVRTGQLCTISDLGSDAGIGYQGQAVGYRKLRSWEEVMIGTVRMIFVLEDFGANESVEFGDEHRTWNDLHYEAERE